jgi:hypothetical protein
MSYTSTSIEKNYISNDLFFTRNEKVNQNIDRANVFFIKAQPQRIYVITYSYLLPEISIIYTASESELKVNSLIFIGGIR